MIRAFFFCSSSGALFGDIIGGFVCQYFQSRKKALILYYAIFIVVFLLYFSPFNNSSTSMYLFCFLVGFSTGILTIILSIGAEQFGTNLRSTAATSIPNMIRASLYVGNYFMITFFPNYFLFNVVESAFATGIIFIFIPFIALFFLEETYHKNLDYVETFKS